MYPDDEGYDLTPERSGKRVFWFLDQDSLAAKFDNWPLLRVLVFSLWFRTVVGLVLLTGLAGLVLLPRVWRTSPPGFKPEVTTRLLDHLRSWSLKRQARQLDAAGRHDQAYSTWHRAWKRDFADPESIRGLLGALSGTVGGDPAAEVALPAGIWLLRLGHTNTADLVLIAHAWLSAGLGDRAFALLDPVHDRLTRDQERVYLMSLFEAGQAGEFGRRIATNAILQAEIAARTRQSPKIAPPGDLRSTFALYHDAYLAGWGPADQHAAARDRLYAARDAKETERLAYDLALAVAVHERDVEGCADILRTLQRASLDSVRHHAAFWMLLLADGRRTEARTLAASSNLAPYSVIDILRLAQAFAALELWEDAEALFHRHQTATRWLWELQVLRTEVLLRQRNWDGLRQLGLEIRTQPDAVDRLGGYSHVAEGLADWHMELYENAERSFARAAEVGIPQPEAALSAAESLLRLDFYAEAEALLLPHRTRLNKNPAFLKALLRCADILRHDQYLLETSQALCKVTPADLIARNNYASALLILRVRPEEAITHTADLLRLLPDRVEPRLNHTAALLRLGRQEEARHQLATIDPRTLSANSLPQFRLLEFELLTSENRTDEALQKVTAIDTARLFPSQRLWFEETIRRLNRPHRP